MMVLVALPKRLAALICFGAAVFGVCAFGASAQPKELRIGVQYGLGYLPLYVARDAGLFEKHMKEQGLEPVPVRIVNFAGGAADSGWIIVANPRRWCGWDYRAPDHA